MSTKEENIARFDAAARAMQSGVAAKMTFDASETSPKHLRVGVNSAHVSDAALLDLLIEKGLVTKEEFFEKLATWMEKEADGYKKEVNAHYGTDGVIDLG